MKKDDLYKRIKIAGIISFIPVILVAGPLSGYFLGAYLEQTFGLAWYVSFITITIGFVASIREVIRAIKLVSKIDREP